jgi:hypothetical protein
VQSVHEHDLRDALELDVDDFYGVEGRSHLGRLPRFTSPVPLFCTGTSAQRSAGRHSISGSHAPDLAFSSVARAFAEQVALRLLRQQEHRARRQARAHRESARASLNVLRPRSHLHLHRSRRMVSAGRGFAACFSRLLARAFIIRLRGPLAWRHDERNALACRPAAKRHRSPARRRGGGGPVPPNFEELLHVPNVLASVLVRTMALPTGGRPAGAHPPRADGAPPNGAWSRGSTTRRKCAAPRRIKRWLRQGSAETCQSHTSTRPGPRSRPDSGDIPKPMLP